MAKTLGELFNLIRNGASIRQYDGASGIPITRIQTISNGIVDRTKVGYANIVDTTSYSGYILQDGDILMSHINSLNHLGKVALYRHVEGETLIHGMNLLVLRANISDINPKYALRLFQSNRFKAALRKIAKKSVNQASFSISDLKRLQVDVPALDDQSHIASLFDTIDCTIAKMQKLTNLLDRLIKSRFIEMFGDPRRLDTNWPCCTLKECCTFYAGTGFPTEYQGLREGDLPFYKVGDISREVQSGHRELGKADNYVSISVAEKLKGKIIPEKTVVFAKIGESLKLNRRAFTSAPSLIDNNVMGVKANDQRLSDIFLFSVLQSIDLGDLSSSTAVPSVRKSTLEKVSIGLPPLELQQVFSDFVIEVDKLRLDVQQQIEKLETLKESLMQEYFG